MIVHFEQPPLINKNGWRTCYYYIIGGFSHNAKAALTTRTAGGLFIFQSSVFRISEKLHNEKQGLALTKKARRGKIRRAYNGGKRNIYIEYRSAVSSVSVINMLFF